MRNSLYLTLTGQHYQEPFFLNYFYNNVCDMVLCEHGEHPYICWIINYNCKII